MKNRISASLMCIDPYDLKDTVKALEKHDVDYMHIDIMDGKFVPNMGIGIDYLHALRKHTKLPFDYHIMSRDPDPIVNNMLDIREDDIVSIHYESTSHLLRTLENIKSNKSCKLFIAINPETSLYVLDELTYFIDGINLLMVNPGFAGQKILRNSFKKAENAANFLKRANRTDIVLEVDGNVSFENAKKLKKLGANMFVAGSSSIFSSNEIETNIARFKDSLMI